MSDQLAATLRVVIAELDEPEQDWPVVEALWMNASGWALETEYEEMLRKGGLGLRLHYADRIRESARQILGDLENGQVGVSNPRCFRHSERRYVSSAGTVECPVAPSGSSAAPYDAVVTENQLAWALRGMLYALNEPEPDWQLIEQEWLEASSAAEGTEHEGAVRTGGILLRLHDADRLAEGIRDLLARLK